MPASDPITAIANAISQIGAVALPYIEESLAQRYENEERETIQKWNRYQQIQDVRSRADAEWGFLLQLLADAKKTVGGNGTNISVPSDALAALIEVAASKIKQDKIISKIQFKQG
jgi:hypothetical protein